MKLGTLQRRAGLALLAATSLVAFAGVACAGEDADANGGDLAVLNAIDTLDKAGLHDIDESINRARAVPATARTAALKMRTVVELTEWPNDLEDAAEKLSAALDDLAKSLEGDNPDKAKAGAAAKNAHDVEHDFSGEVWEYLYKEAGIGAGAAAHN